MRLKKLSAVVLSAVMTASLLCQGGAAISVNAMDGEESAVETTVEDSTEESVTETVTETTTEATIEAVTEVTTEASTEVVRESSTQEEDDVEVSETPIYIQTADDISRNTANDSKHVVETDPELEEIVVSDDLDIQTISGTGTVSQLKSDVFQQSQYNQTVVFNQANNGVYFVKSQNSLEFYDISSGTYTTVYTNTSSQKCYVGESAVYFATPKYTYKNGSNSSDGYYCTITVDKYDLNTKSLTTMTLGSIETNSYWSNLIAALGADSSGRIYLATNEDELYLFSSSGNLLSSCGYTGDILQFYGFDSTNGNFYYRGYYNWVYWGYNHSMASLMAGNVNSSNQITVTEQNLSILYQNGWYVHSGCAEMLNGKYLAVLSTFASDLLMIVDSNAYNYTDYTSQSTSISLVDSGVSVSTLNISNTAAQKMAVYTADSDYESYFDVSSEGTRCVMGTSGDSVIVKTGDNTLTEYSLSSQSAVIKCVTSHPVYDMAMFGDTLVAFERDGDNYYVETIPWTYPSDYTASIPSEMKVGESAQITCSASSQLALDYTYSSSNSKVVSVDADGNLNAWKAGSAVITVKSSPTDITKTFTITVKESDVSKNVSYKVTNTSGTKSSTVHSSNSGSTVTANLAQVASNRYERVEFINNAVCIETYDENYNLVGTKSISPELTKFGGYYYGDGYRYLVFGENNTSESDSVEVIRVVKYDSNWNRVGACSIYGANTRSPFGYGLDMTEAGGKLYIHTCHTMYVSDDGYNHQANADFVINESDMTLADSYSDIMNISYGYVSHSFSQKVTTDGSYVYRADLGDAYPRGIAYTKTSVNSKINNPSYYATLISIDGNTGNNYTGYKLDGLEVTENYAVLMGSGVNAITDSQANMWIYSVNKETNEGKKVMLTNYSNGNNVTVGTSRLVKLNNNQLLAMWEEKSGSSSAYTTKMVLISEDGQIVSDVYSNSLALGECEPIVKENGNVLWYVTSSGSPVFIEINPYRLSEITGASSSAGNSTGETAVTAVGGVTLSGKAHVQTYGNQSGTWDGTTLTLGTTGKSKRLESITVNLTNNTGYSGTIEYRVHRQTYGWTNWVQAGQAAGTTGQSKRLEAIEMRLTGELAEHYSIRYKVHIQTYGWNQGWQYDGALAGTTGESKRLESLEIELVEKTVPMGITYRVHRQTYGWEKTWQSSGGLAGTTGQSKRLEGITIALTGNEYSGGITYKTHVQSYGWMSAVSNGTMSGTSGKSKRLEAIQISLTGEVAEHYDVYYRVHSQTYGWLGWAKNGESAGTEGFAKRLESIQIVLVPKGSSAPSNSYGGVTSKNSKAYIKK